MVKLRVSIVEVFIVDLVNLLFGENVMEQKRIDLATLRARQAMDAHDDDPAQTTRDTLLCSLELIHELLTGQAYYDYENQVWVKEVTA